MLTQGEANVNHTFWSQYCIDEATMNFAVPGGGGDEYNGVFNDEVGTNMVDVVERDF